MVSVDELFRRYSGPGVVPADLWERVGEDIARDVLRRFPKPTSGDDLKVQGEESNAD